MPKQRRTAKSSCKRSDYARRLDRGRRIPVAPATPRFCVWKDPSSLSISHTVSQPIALTALA